jgi:hypothetical protein
MQYQILERKSWCLTAPTATTSCLWSVSGQACGGYLTLTHLDGFTYTDNDHESLQLDKILLPTFSEAQRELLYGLGYLGYDPEAILQCNLT